MSALSIIDLPPEALMAIFDRSDNGANLSLVCRRFYEVECLRTQNRFKMVITADLLRDKVARESILNTQRVCSDVEIRCLEMEPIAPFIVLTRSLLEKHGWRFRTADIHITADIGEVEMVDILNLLPNITHLFFCAGKIFRSRPTRRVRRKLVVNNLTKICLSIHSNSMLSFLIKYLRQDSIERMTLWFGDEPLDGDTFGAFIWHQRSVRYLTAAIDFAFFKYFNLLNLTTLIIEPWAEVALDEEDMGGVAAVLMSQQALKFLEVDFDVIFDDTVFVGIGSLNTIKRLRVNIDGFSPEIIEQLGNLQELVDLEVYCSLQEVMHTLSVQPLITTGRMEVTTPIALDGQLIANFTETYPRVRVTFNPHQDVTAEVHGGIAGVEPPEQAGQQDEVGGHNILEDGMEEELEDGALNEG